MIRNRIPMTLKTNRKNKDSAKPDFSIITPRIPKPNVETRRFMVFKYDS